ncbi:hypothetical protein LSH36_463g06057 [Paralvinella palmiformis]|uniref:Uncharacterized protein n=1 Tax=Paralvinella palmiformis TaxID=53620 RepID=A0AAD9MXM0_9ANNE|nr:hypothetical protein LSH36_463g06057 [Paralvinella palmiformis]
MDVFTPNEVGEQWHPSNSFSHINPIIYHLPSCDLFQDTGDLPHSEGEFHPAVLTKRSTMRGVMEQLEQINSWSVQRLDHPVIQAPRVNVSLGEVNLHQRLASVSHPDQPYFNPQSTPAISHTNNGRLSRGAHEQQSLGKALLCEEVEQKFESPKVKTISVQPRPAVIGGSPIRGQIRPVTVTPGGREPSRHYKHGYGPGARQRNIQTSRSFSPEPSGGATRASDKLSEAGTSHTSLLASSDLDTQTSDQINVEALLQSQDYFANTQSDLGSTAGDAEFAQMGKLTYSLTRSEELRYQSMVMQQSPGSTSDMSLAPGLTKTLERSEEELAQDSRQSYDDNSDLQLTDEKKGKTKEAARSGPLQVSVTIPSVGEEDSQTQESYEDVSEISLV